MNGKHEDTVEEDWGYLILVKDASEDGRRVEVGDAVALD